MVFVVYVSCLDCDDVGLVFGRVVCVAVCGWFDLHTAFLCGFVVFKTCFWVCGWFAVGRFCYWLVLGCGGFGLGCFDFVFAFVVFW